MEADPVDSGRAGAVKFQIQPGIFTIFPGLHIGVVRARGLDNRTESPQVRSTIQKVQEEIRQKFDLETLSKHPKIQSWRNAYTRFGAKPKKHRSSVENLYRMTLEGKPLRPVNRIVDIYNCASLVHMVPVGGDDLTKVSGDVQLRLARGDETFFPLGSSEEQRVREGEVVYADEREVLCRRWNWRESETTKMTERTSDVLLVSEGLPPVTGKEMGKVVKDIKEMILDHCGGEVDVTVLDAANNAWEL